MEAKAKALLLVLVQLCCCSNMQGGMVLGSTEVVEVHKMDNWREFEARDALSVLEEYRGTQVVMPGKHRKGFGVLLARSVPFVLIWDESEKITSVLLRVSRVPGKEWLEELTHDNREKNVFEGVVDSEEEIRFDARMLEEAVKRMIKENPKGASRAKVIVRGEGVVPDREVVLFLKLVYDLLEDPVSEFKDNPEARSYVETYIKGVRNEDPYNDVVAASANVYVPPMRRTKTYTSANVYVKRKKTYGDLVRELLKLKRNGIYVAKDDRRHMGLVWLTHNRFIPTNKDRTSYDSPQGGKLNEKQMKKQLIEKNWRDPEKNP